MARFDAATMGIRTKAVIATDPRAEFILLTQLCSTDINMYLISVSSFCQYLKPKEIYVVADRMTSEECALLVRCIPGLKIIPIEDSRVDGLPTGGTWERIIAIHNLVNDYYVVQLDADTVTIQYPQEVAEAIETGVSFTITTKMGGKKLRLSQLHELVGEVDSDHVQVVAEKAFPSMRNAENRYYVRGCSGFAGFAKGSSRVVDLEEFSSEVQGKIGREKWYEWGSEQVTSCYIIANSENSVILPFEYYPYHVPGMDVSDVRLIHFIGDRRFEGGLYRSLSKQVIASL